MQNPREWDQTWMANETSTGVDACICYLVTFQVRYHSCPANSRFAFAPFGRARTRTVT
jgi:hypothetical protein